MRKAFLAATVLFAGAVLVPAGPARAAGTCNGLPVTITGTAGNDTIVGTAGNDVISAGAGNDTVLAGAGDDTVCLGPGNDTMNGGDGADTMVADAVPDGADTFLAGSLDLGDTVTYAARTTPVNVSLDNVANDGAPGEGDNIASDVHVVVGGSAGDTLSALATGGQSVLRGGPGNDTLNGNFTLIGDAGDDTLRLISVASGNLFGGDGTDTLFGGPVSDNLSGGNGNDTIHGGAGDDSMFGGPGNDTLLGEDGADFMSGDDGDDTLIGGLGDDSPNGGAGNDTFESLVSADGADFISGGDGVDTASYRFRQAGANVTVSLSLDNVANDGQPGEGDDIFTDVENLTGAVSPNVISGDTAPNVLTGGQSNDVIFGADGISGNDTVIGGLGTDACTSDPGDVESCEI